MEDPEQSKNIIDSIDWLYQRAEKALRDNDESAGVYLERLTTACDDPAILLFAHSNLGILEFSRGDTDMARYHFDEAGDLAPDDPNVLYAKGHCEARQGRWWQALIYFVEAAHFGQRTVEEVEFIRSIGVALGKVGHAEEAHVALLGALERQPTNPYILESLGRHYEEQEQWVEAIRVRDHLIEILKGRDPGHRSPKAPGLNASLDSEALDEESIRERVLTINSRMRERVEVVDKETHRDAIDAFLSTTQHPAGLHTTVDALSRRGRPLALLETAQSLWARARHERFDVHLNPYTLAATIHWITERLHWREVTGSAELRQLYDVEPERIRAAVRLLVSQFNIRLFDTEDARSVLARNRVERLERLLQARVLDVGIHELEPVKMLM